MNHYRYLVKRRNTDTTTSLAAATEAMRGAALESANREKTAGGYMSSGWISTLSRIDMTESVALLLTIKDRAYLLEGDERLWMIPFYPFIPRFIWRDKPIQDLGNRFTRVLGGRGYTCTSPTIIGDLYVLHGGIPGVLVGMFLVGLAAQWLTNPIKRLASKRNLFIYACVFFNVANFENDYFAYTTALIRTVVIVNILASVFYGPRRLPERFWKKPVKPTRSDTGERNLPGATAREGVVG